MAGKFSQRPSVVEYARDNGRKLDRHRRSPIQPSGVTVQSSYYSRQKNTVAAFLGIALLGFLVGLAMVLSCQPSV